MNQRAIAVALAALIALVLQVAALSVKTEDGKNVAPAAQQEAGQRPPHFTDVPPPGFAEPIMPDITGEGGEHDVGVEGIEGVTPEMIEAMMMNSDGDSFTLPNGMKIEKVRVGDGDGEHQQQPTHHPHHDQQHHEAPQPEDDIPPPHPGIRYTDTGEVFENVETGEGGIPLDAGILESLGLTPNGNDQGATGHKEAENRAPHPRKQEKGQAEAAEEEPLEFHQTTDEIGEDLMSENDTEGGAGGGPYEEEEEAEGGLTKQVFPKSRRCHTCALFAAAYRKALWESTPPLSVVNTKERRKLIVHEDRIEDAMDESFDIIMSKYLFVTDSHLETAKKGQKQSKTSNNIQEDKDDSSKTDNEFFVNGRPNTYWPRVEAIRHGVADPPPEEGHSLKPDSRGAPRNPNQFGEEQGLLEFIREELIADNEEALETMGRRDLASRSPTKSTSRRAGNQKDSELLPESDFITLPRGNAEFQHDGVASNSTLPPISLKVFSDEEKEHDSLRAWVKELCVPRFCPNADMITEGLVLPVEAEEILQS